MKQYYIHRAAGDFIYAIPAVRKHSQDFCFVNGMDKKLSDSLKPLIESQGIPFYHETEVTLKDFVNLEIAKYQDNVHRQHLAKTYADILGVEIDLKQSWLKFYHTEPRHYAVVSVTSRYRDKIFNWAKEITWLRKRTKHILFLGYEQEYIDFIIKWGVGSLITYLETENHLHAAQVIAGAGYFSGTCSSMLAIRQGLGLPYRFERPPFHDSVMTGRDNETVLNPYTRKIHRFVSNIKSAVNL